MTETKERLLNTGLDLLTREGFAGVTLGVLARQAGLSKSGVFAHFRSKSALQLELLERMLLIGSASFVAPAMERPVGLPRLEAVIEGWLGWTEKAGLHGGCPVAAGMFEWDDGDPDDPVRQRLLAMQNQWQTFLSQLTGEAISTGELRQDLDVDQFVWELCGIYLSHHVSHRFMRDRQAKRRARTAVGSLIARSRNPEPKPAKTLSKVSYRKNRKT